MKEHFRIIGLTLLTMLGLLFVQAMTDPVKTAKQVGALYHNVCQSFQAGVQGVPAKQK